MTAVAFTGGAMPCHSDEQAWALLRSAIDDFSALPALADRLKEMGAEELPGLELAMRGWAEPAPASVFDGGRQVELDGWRVRRNKAWLALTCLCVRYALLRKLTVPDVVPLTTYYRDKCHATVGGSLHVFLGGNHDDNSILWCQEFSLQEGDPAGAALADVLLAMTPTQRRKISRCFYRSKAKAAT